MQLIEGQQRAKQIIEKIQPYCQRIEVAGSVRRLKPEVGDVEIVAVPKAEIEAMRSLRQIVNNDWGPPKKGAFPSKYTCVRGLLDIDFWWTTPTKFGLIYFIRTGSDDFVTRALAYWKTITKGGFCRGGQFYKPDGHGNFTVVETPEELDVFNALDIKWVSPEKRLPKIQSYPKRQRSNPPKDEEFDFQ